MSKLNRHDRRAQAAKVRKDLRQRKWKAKPGAFYVVTDVGNEIQYGTYSDFQITYETEQAA